MPLDMIEDYVLLTYYRFFNIRGAVELREGQIITDCRRQ